MREKEGESARRRGGAGREIRGCGGVSAPVRESRFRNALTLSPFSLSLLARRRPRVRPVLAATLTRGRVAAGRHHRRSSQQQHSAATATAAAATPIEREGERRPAS